MLVFLLFSAGVSFASDCSELRLDAPGGSMEKIEAPRQIGGTCYAYATAQMLDAWRLSHGVNKPGERVSAYAMALWNGELKDRETVNGGKACLLAKMTRDRGACSVSGLPSVSADGKTQLKTLIGMLRKEYQGAQTEAVTQDRLGLIRAMLETYGVAEAASLGDPEVEEALGADDEISFLAALLVGEDCRGTRLTPKVPGCDYKKIRRAKEDKALKYVLRRLDQISDQPLGFTYCAGVLKQGRKFPGIADDGTVPENCGKHVSLIIGKREREGRCELLVRNSWGTGCKSYSEDWECEKGKGNIWVDAEKLLDSSRYFYRID